LVAYDRKEILMKILLILCIFVISGCGTTGKVFKFEDGVKKQAVEIHLNKTGGMKYKENPDGTVECEFDSRAPTLWDRWISPIITGASDRTQGTVTAK